MAVENHSSVVGFRFFAAYGFDYGDIGYEAGLKAADILKGEKEAGEIPVDYPQKLKLQVSKKAAEAMNVEINEDWKDAELID